MEETWERIVKRILYLCRIKNIGINTLAFRAGLTPSTLKSILYGKSKNPGIVTIRHICDGLGVSLEEFFHSRLFMEW
ncbi:MAG: helix-turn-helix transcriptional regulator [Lachnospiraceae bacterium]|nr:helix-turn-helix transcriptional regulator [Lachnospiraceae bacterium]